MPATLVKCRLCGAELLLAEDEESKRCPYCKTVNTRPKSTGDTLNILNLATEQRLAKDYVRAAESYQRVLELQKDEYEARWGLALCKYGVEFVTDPRTGRQMPVCHTARIKPMREDADYQRACELAPEDVRVRYVMDASYIDVAQQRIRELQKSEPGYDIFLCYKETALDSNDPTVESRDARRLYNSLTRKGYRVFFAPETLAAQAGENYEAGIYHAIATAKVMLVIGRRADHLTSTWVQSEWTRYLERIDSGEDKHLIPLYGGMDASELPQPFLNRNLQGLNLTSLTWELDLDSALLKYFPPKQAPATPTAPPPQPEQPAPAPQAPQPDKQPAPAPETPPKQPRKARKAAKQEKPARKDKAQDGDAKPRKKGRKLKVILAIWLLFIIIGVTFAIYFNNSVRFDTTTDGNGGLVITDVYNAPSDTLIVPATIAGKPVTGIAESAFLFLNTKRVYISDGVVSIGCSAFTLAEVQFVSIPDSVTFIGSDAFMKKAVIECSRGSEAEKWAQQNGNEIQYR